MVGPADLIVTGAKVITVDPSNSIAEAVAVRDDKIVAVGGAADIAALTAEHTQTIEAGEKPYRLSIAVSDSVANIEKQRSLFVVI